LPELFFLRFHLLFAGKGRVEQDHALYAHSCRCCGLQGSHGSRDGHVVCDVRAGADAGQEDLDKVPVLRQPRVRARRHPVERGTGVVVGCREQVLGRQAVVDGDGDDAGASELT
jgi:hypothetical protein